MFDFLSLKAVSADDGGNLYSFVGISDGELRLPKGCDVWASSINNDAEPAKKFAAMQETFLTLYRTLRVYRQVKFVSLTNDRDSAQQGKRGGQEVLGRHKEDSDIIYYRHLDMLDGILEVHDELSILSLAQRIGRSERLDYSKLHHHLDRAAFLDDDSFVVDEMMLPRQQVSFEPVEIVQMYCFVLFEIRKWLSEADDVTSDIRALSEQFVEHHLATGDGLFNFETWQRTRNILRERLEIIDQNTAYKDEAYHDLYDALERFLWGEAQQSTNGIQWGISTFAPVWESMCLNYLIENRLWEVAACDTGSLPEVLTNRLTLLTNKEESEVAPGMITAMRTIKELEGVFRLNGTQLFPDCTLIPCLDNYQNWLYEIYDVDNLADRSSGSTADQRIDQKFRAIWQGLKSRGGHKQNDEANSLLARLGLGVPDNLTAFFLGRALSASFQSENEAVYPREKTCKKLIEKVGSTFHLHFLRGMVWEIYYDNKDQLRVEGKVSDNHSLANRKWLYSYKLAMKCIADNKDKYPEINALNDFVRMAEAEIAGNPSEQCTVVDFKYLTADYFKNEENAAHVRTRSVRKQFVYECLLERKLGETCSIISEFWIPDYGDDCTKIDLGLDKQFLGGFIPLRRFNVAALINSYWRCGSSGDSIKSRFGFSSTSLESGTLSLCKLKGITIGV